MIFVGLFSLISIPMLRYIFKYLSLISTREKVIALLNFIKLLVQLNVKVLILFDEIYYFSPVS